ncbi:MAG: hypothetical protein MI919_18760, partial [Holophagales bacterium]|nr:hypothetical protein [Holophagales bacterium]
TPDGTIRYAKYRLIPADGIPETGTVIDDPEEMKIEPGNQRTLPGEERCRNYLREEFHARVARGPVRYRLQIQLHEAREDDDPEIFNCCREWDPETHPFHDLAHVEIDRVLDWQTSCMTSFSIRNAPAGLGVLPSDSIYDYNSLNYLRSHSELARNSRLWSYRTFGVPPEIPDDDQRNQ